MDGLRKLVSGWLQVQAGGPHPDPDVLAAFAENALLDSERAQLLQHLGACKDCREILYLAAPDSAEAHKVLSFQPKRSAGLMFRWGALAASVVIIGAVVVAKYPRFHARNQPSAAATPVSTYAKMEEEKIPVEDEAMRNSRNGQPSSPSPAPRAAGEGRPEAKHMTAKPQAGLEFDDSGQVRISHGSVADESKKSRADDLALLGRNVMPLTVPGASAAKPVSPPAVAGMLAKDKNEIRADYANLDQLAREKAARGNLGGTIIDPSGAVVGNAKVTVSGPVGKETAISDPAGRFAFHSLTPGLYSVKAEASGFKVGEVKQVAVLENKSATIGVKLQPGQASETVEVSGAGAVETAEVVAAAPPLDAKSGIGLAQKPRAQAEMQTAMETNSPRRAKVATPTPQWTLSSEGAIQRSYDVGKSWQTVSVASGTMFRALCAVGTQVWAGGSEGKLYHSIDSGQSWTQVVPATPDQKLTADIIHIEFSDPANGSVSTTNGEVWSTSDGGQNWRRK